MIDVMEQIYGLRDEYIKQNFNDPIKVYITRDAEKALLLQEIEKEIERSKVTYFVRWIDLRTYNSLYGMKIVWDSDELKVA